MTTDCAVSHCFPPIRILALCQVPRLCVYCPALDYVRSVISPSIIDQCVVVVYERAGHKLRDESMQSTLPAPDLALHTLFLFYGGFPVNCLMTGSLVCTLSYTK